MPSLSTILVDGDGEGPRNWNVQPFGSIDEGIAAADGTEIVAATGTQNRNLSLDTSFDTAVVETDIDNVDALSYDVRYRADNSVGDDTVTFGIRVMSGATVLAAADSGGTFQVVLSAANSAWHTTLQNKGVTAFTFVSPTAAQADWDAAEIEFRSTHAAVMSPDDNWVIVDTVELTGTYTAVAGAAPIVVLTNRPLPLPEPDRPSTFILLPPAPSVIEETINEAMGLTDDVTAAKTITVVINESMGLSDVVERVHDAVRIINEPLGLLDAANPVKTIARTINEALGLVDDVAPVKAISVEITEAMGLTDVVERVHAAVRTITEALGLADQVLPVKNIPRTINEAMGLADVAERALTYARTITEAFGLSDSTDAAKAIGQIITESLGLTDDVSRVHDAVRTISESMGLTDTTIPQLTGGGSVINVTITETMGLTDNVATSGNTFWRPDPEAVTKNPEAVTKTPVGFTKVKASDAPPAGW